ncbi:MAG: class I SAM-dependent methyltransferase [Simkaniaceae bacterium]|nr:class I SAM-dependent methyltransferase [Simkaniaceae bacterium]
MDNFFIESIFEKNRSMQTREQMLNLYYLLRETLPLPGDVVELGTYRGLTAILLQKTLRQAGSSKKIHVYDSFEGLPEKGVEDLVVSDEHMRRIDFLDNRRINKGWFASPLSALEELFREWHEPLPEIHAGFFEETLPHLLPEQIAFAHLDADLYGSTKIALEAILPRMVKGSILVVDDYCDLTVHPRQNTFPGVKQACDEVFRESLDILCGGNKVHAVRRF